MFVFNFKFNMKKILIISAIIIIAIALVFEISNMVKANSNATDYILDENNFTEVLQTVHENIDKNVGKTIKLSLTVARVIFGLAGSFLELLSSEDLSLSIYGCRSSTASLITLADLTT